MQANQNGGVPQSPNPNQFLGETWEVVLLQLGNSGVGKTSISERFSKGTFSQNFITTLGIEPQVKTIQLRNGLKIKVRVWDPPGQDRFETLVSSYYREAQGFVLIYDVNDPQSLLNLEKHWITELQRYARPNAQCVLVGNKWDDPKARMAVSLEQAKAFADYYEMPLYFASAKQNTNITAIYDDITSRIARQMAASKQRAQDEAKAKSVVNVDEDYSPPKSCKWFCGLFSSSP